MKRGGEDGRAGGEKGRRGGEEEGGRRGEEGGRRGGEEERRRGGREERRIGGEEEEEGEGGIVGLIHQLRKVKLLDSCSCFPGWEKGWNVAGGGKQSDIYCKRPLFERKL